MHVQAIAEKASYYGLLAEYYKYIDPACHIHYYQKHYYYVCWLVQCEQSKAQGHHQVNAPYHPYREQRETRTIADPSKYTYYSYIRVLHASPDAPPVDVYVNGQPLLRQFAYEQFSQYARVPENKYVIEVFPAGETDQPVLSETLTLEGGQAYTLAVGNRLEDLSLYVYEDSPRVPANESKVRFIHLAPGAPNVTVRVKDRDNVFENVAFSEVTDYLGISPMTIDLEVVDANTGSVVLDVPDVTFEPNRVYSIYAIGLAGAEPPLQALILED
ncbi:DUF4397 domain-containing protein [Bacillaceae bacterium SIJ1]|uniref:DUF4397 domain-containing protein n=1 Tax=Litoribacterium kuwaitense TaxID=1398745 RepID=UPI0013EAC4DC|nr:DUF4397 domain-containing protein [Litoribacterium kuwaitense]NGP46756.1 DUF4397 domain-containing protein [Litoribacterium kuwaitense]